MRSQGALRIVLLIVLATALLVGLGLANVPGEGGGDPHSVWSARDKGRLALYLLLQELGWDVRAWNEAPGELSGEALLVLPRAPEPPPGHDAELTPPGAWRQRDPLHYRRFLEEGGTILVAWTDDVEDFFDDLGLSRLWLLHGPIDSDEPRESVVFADGETVAVDERDARELEIVEEYPFDVVAADPLGRVVAAETRVGRGRVVVLASDQLFENRFIGKAENALFAVRLVEEVAPAGPILFDEYALGAWAPESPLELAASPRVRPLTVQLLLVAAVLLWRSRRRGFPRDPEPLAQLAALTRAEGGARLFLAAGRTGPLVDLLRYGVLRKLLGRRALAPRAPEEGLRSGLAAARAALQDEDRLSGLLARRFARYGPDAVERARAAFGLGSAVDRPTDLDAVAARLASLEGLADSDPETP